MRSFVGMFIRSWSKNALNGNDLTTLLFMPRLTLYEDLSLLRLIVILSFDQIRMLMLPLTGFVVKCG